MEIKRLDHSDFDQIKDLFWRCHSAQADRANIRKGKTVDTENQLLEIEQFWKIWSAGIQRYYLTHDDYHYLFGIYKDDLLMSIVGWRCDLPAPYDKDWVIVYLKSDPTVNTLRKYVAPLWELMFNMCEERELTSWHSLIEPDRWSKFDAFYQRMISQINNRYEYTTTWEIPAGTKPDEEWVWAMMGRRPLKVDYIVRTGKRKNENV